MNFGLLRAAAAFIFQGTMANRCKLEQKGILDLPDEIIEDKIMAILSNQDLCKLIGTGNRRLKDCCHRIMKKRPYSKYHLAIVFLIK